MELPSVIHPKLVKFNGFTFRIVAFCKMTDEQALKIAIQFYHSHKLKKENRNKILKVMTHHDQDSLSFL